MTATAASQIKDGKVVRMVNLAWLLIMQHAHTYNKIVHHIKGLWLSPLADNLTHVYIVSLVHTEHCIVLASASRCVVFWSF